MTPAPFAYSAFGLRLVSSRQLSGLTLIDGETATADLQIEFLEGPTEIIGDPEGETLWYTTDILDEQGDPALRIWKGRRVGEYFIRYVNGLTFCLNSAITCVRVSCGKMSHADVCSFLLGPVMGIALRMRGTTCLHASAVEIRGSAVAFVGEMGAGKSTAAAIFARNGHAVLTDDIVALEKCGDAFFARSSYPFLNLLPDSMALVFGTSDGSCSTDPEVEKTQVMLDGRGLRFESRLLALDRVYILERASETTATTILPVRPQEALIALSSQTYANKILDQQMRAREFQMLGELVRNVAVRRLITPANGPEIDNLYCAIIQDVSPTARVGSC